MKASSRVFVMINGVAVVTPLIAILVQLIIILFVLLDSIVIALRAIQLLSVHGQPVEEFESG